MGGNIIKGTVLKRLYLAGIVITCILFLSISGIFGTKTSLETKWVGVLTYGQEYSGVDSGIFDREEMFEIEYHDGIIIGLRDDGVVVWKEAANDTLVSWAMFRGNPFQ